MIGVRDVATGQFVLVAAPAMDAEFEVQDS